MILEAVAAGMSMLCVICILMLTSSERPLALKDVPLGSVTGFFWMRRVVPPNLDSKTSAGRRGLLELVDWPVERMIEPVRRRVGSSPCGRSLVVAVAVVVCKGLLCLFLTWLRPSNRCFPGFGEVFIEPTRCGVVLSPRDVSEGVYEGLPEEAVSYGSFKTAGSSGFAALSICEFVLQDSADSCTAWEIPDTELAATEVVVAGP